MSDSPQAVFLSYASQDSEAARRICESLRAAGIEVWFDQNELRGGDAWDAKIKRQIRECALFVPVISANTQARLEGYFRREWKLAVERTHDMADHLPFLVPVAIDGTPEREAHVPEAFLRVQWTRIQGEKEFVSFAARIRDMMTGTGGFVADRPGSGLAAPGTARPGRDPRAIRKRIAPALIVAGTLILGLGILWFARTSKPDGATTPDPGGALSRAVADQNGTALPPVPQDRSIAVLPFTNLNDDAERSAFLVLGLHEQLLSSLYNIRDLRVAGYDAVMEYRSTSRKNRQIAQELGVAYLLKATVQTSGARVRVTSRLIDAAAEKDLWVKSFESERGDVFSIQSELSNAIAAVLKGTISEREKTLLAGRPTASLEAYELFLRSRERLNSPSGLSDAGMREQVGLLTRAVELDPDFVAAHAELAYLFAYAANTRAVGVLGNLAAAKEAIDHAARLAPESPEVIRAMGDYYYYGHRDYDRAAEQYEKLRGLRPNDPVYYDRMGSMSRRQGQWREAMENWRKLEHLDPGSLRAIRDLVSILSAGRRFDEAIEAQKRLLLRTPGDVQARHRLAYLGFLAHGTTSELDAFFAGLDPAQRRSMLGYQSLWALDKGDLQGAMALDAEVPPGAGYVIDLATVHAARGDFAKARDRIGSYEPLVRARTEAEPKDAAAWANLGACLALMGRKEEALAASRLAVELASGVGDALGMLRFRAGLAFVLTWTGEKDAAIAEYSALLKTPYGLMSTIAGLQGISVEVMKRNPRFAPLRDDPRWETLLNDPKNNAPLF
jgi:TolB-like protein/Flp pilus assembly protein TadD